MRRVIIDCLSSDIKTALCDNDELIEFITEDNKKKITVGDIYVGRVEKILPSKMAFVNLGFEKNTFLQLTDKKQESLYEYDELTDKYKLKIKQGDSIIVQIEKDGSELKGAEVKANLSFAGKYVVLIVNQKGIGVSKKIEDNELKAKLKKMAEEVLPEGYALIMRTNCENADFEDIKNEILALYEKCKNVVEKGQYIKPPALLYEAENETEKILRDFIIYKNDEIVINNKEIFDKYINTDLKDRVKLYESEVPIFENYGVQSQLDKALNNKVWLKSGGFIIIDEVEACNVIDVNSGKFIGKNQRQTALKTNLEAAREIAKQIRLRNLSGMIIIDFIDMTEYEDNEAVTAELKKWVKFDRINVTVVGMTELGLMQMTRKKTSVSLSKALTMPCPHCMGSGRIENESYIAHRIRNKICNIFASTIYDLVTISSNKRIIDAVKGDNDEYKLIEEKFGKKINFNVISTQKLDYFEIEKEKMK